MQDISFLQRESEENGETVSNAPAEKEEKVLESLSEHSAVTASPDGVVSVEPPVSVSPSIASLSDMETREPIFSGSDEGGAGKKKISMRVVLGVGIALIVFGGIFGGVWGYGKYQKVYGSVSVEKMFPKNVDFVARVSVKADAPQVQMLQAVAQKFPGYASLRKQWDATGEGKDADQSFLDEWKQFGVNFDEEVLPVIGDAAWIAVPDLNPVEQVVGRELGVVFPKTETILANISSSEIPSRVLGEQTARPLQKAGSVNVLRSEVPALDFILGVPVTDMKKALSVIEKMQKENDRYQITPHTYKGYVYIELFDTKYEANAEGSEDALRLNAARTFHGLLGGNWVTVSRDDWMREMIDRRDALLGFSFSKKESSSGSLEGNENVEKVMRSLQVEENNLVTAYYKWDLSNDCIEGDSCSNGSKDQNVQEGGVSVRLNEDGVLVRFSQLQGGKEFQEQKNGYENGLALQIPKNVDNRWADVFFEISDPKGAYYDFKKNYLTDQDLAEWNNNLDESYQDSGVHMERDVVDNFSGEAGVVMLTSKSAFPEIFGMARFAEGKGEMILRNFFSKKVTEENELAQGCQNISPKQKTFLCDSYMAEFSSVEEVQSEFGVMIREKRKKSKDQDPFSSLFEVCGGVGKNGVTIFGTSCSGVSAILESFGAKIEEKKTISNNEEYRFAEKYVGNEGLSRMHVVPLGFFYAVTGIFNQIASSFDSIPAQDAAFSQYQERQRQERATTVAGLEGIFKTIPSITVQNNSAESSTMFIHIKELPKEEKEKADANVARMMSEEKKTQSNAKNASFKSYANSLVPGIIMCCDYPGAKLQTEVGKAICQEDVNRGLFSAKELSVDSVEYRVKKNCDADGNFEFEMQTFGNGACSGVITITPDGARFPEGC